MISNSSSEKGKPAELIGSSVVARRRSRPVNPIHNYGFQPMQTSTTPNISRVNSETSPCSNQSSISDSKSNLQSEMYRILAHSHSHNSNNYSSTVTPLHDMQKIVYPHSSSVDKSHLGSINLPGENNENTAPLYDQISSDLDTDAIFMETDIDTGTQQIRISPVQVHETDIDEIPSQRIFSRSDCEIAHPDVMVQFKEPEMRQKQSSVISLQEKLIKQAGSDCEVRVANSLSRLEIPHWFKNLQLRPFRDESESCDRIPTLENYLRHSCPPSSNILNNPHETITFYSKPTYSEKTEIDSSWSLLSPEPCEEHGTNEEKISSKGMRKCYSRPPFVHSQPVLKPIHSNIRDVFNSVRKINECGSMHLVGSEKKFITERMHQKTTTSFTNSQTLQDLSSVLMQPGKSVTKVKKITNVTRIIHSKDPPLRPINKVMSMPTDLTADVTVGNLFTPLPRRSFPSRGSRKTNDIHTLKSIISSQSLFSFLSPEEQETLFRIESDERIVNHSSDTSSPVLSRDNFLKKPRIIFQDYFINHHMNCLCVGRDALQRRTLICGYSSCRKESLLSMAYESYHSCYNCFTYYCSRDCRERDWPHHRGSCSFGRLKFWSNTLAASLHSRQKHALANLVKKCRTFYGRGSVMLAFYSAAHIQMFLEDKSSTNCFMSPPFYCSSDDLALLDDALLPLCMNHDQSNSFVITILVAALSNVSGHHRPRLYKHCLLISLPMTHEISMNLTIDSTESQQESNEGNPLVKKRKKHLKAGKDELGRIAFACEPSYTVKRTAF